ncbi:MAG: hypothetical protein VB913_08465 [Rhodospirillales bacterium]
MTDLFAGADQSCKSSTVVVFATIERSAPPLANMLHWRGGGAKDLAGKRNFTLPPLPW